MLETRIVPVASFESASGVAAKYGTYEVVLTGNGSVSNPFDTNGTVTFTSPSNISITVNDFYDGGNTWRARTYVTETGTWNWTAKSAEDSGLNNKSGSFVASDTGLPGLLKINPSNTKAWINERNQPFVYTGYASWVLFNQNPAVSPNYQEFINDAVTFGINTFGPTGLLGSWGTQPLLTEVGSNDPWLTGNMSKYDLNKFQTTDTRLKWMLNNKPEIYVQGQWLGNEWQYDDGWFTIPQSVRHNTMDYMISRWAAIPNMIWLISQDQRMGLSGTRAFNRDVGNYIASNSPWRHLLSTLSIDNEFSFTTPSDLNWCDYASLQIGQDPIDLNANLVQAFSSFPRHIQLTEDWYEQDDFWHDELAETSDIDFYVRWDFWAWTLAGGSANYGARWTRPDPYSETENIPYIHPISQTDFTGQALRGLDSLPHFQSYFSNRNIDVGNFQSANDLATSWSMAGGLNWHPNVTRRNSDEFLVYVPNAAQENAFAKLDTARTASVTLDLTSASGTFAVEWFHPSNGTVQNGTVISGGGPRTLTAPWMGTDVVVRLLKTSPAPVITDVLVNDGSVQRSRVTSLQVTFDRIVTFAGPIADAFQMSRQGDGWVVNFTATVTVINSKTVVTLNNLSGPATEFGSMADGKFVLTALANQISAGGQALDGNGNGVGGDDFSSPTAGSGVLFRLFGDASGDGHVGSEDFSEFRNYFGLPSTSMFDFNGDNHVDANDFASFRLRFGVSIIP